MKKLLLTGIAALLLATGTAHAGELGTEQVRKEWRAQCARGDQDACRDLCHAPEDNCDAEGNPPGIPEAAQAAVRLNNKEIMGDWCFGPDGDEDGRGWLQPRSWAIKDTPCVSFISFKLDSIKSEYEEGGCTATAIKTRYDPTIATATKTPPGALVSTINMSCGGEGCRWRQRITVYFAKGVLFYKSNWRSRAKCG